MKNLETTIGTVGIAQKMVIRPYETKKGSEKEKPYVIKYHEVTKCGHNQF